MDILFEVLTLSSYQPALCEGHIEKIYHIFAFLKNDTNLTLYFDTQDPNIDPSWFNGGPTNQLKYQYQDTKDQFSPSHMLPKYQGVPVSTTSYVNSLHASNKITCRSHTRFIILPNVTPTIWYRKRQNKVEASTFSSEFIAMKCILNISHH